MPDTKISAAADIGTVTATDMVPVARSGSGSAYHATMAELATWANTNLPVASTTTLGGVKVDGSTITISSGVISGVATLVPWSSAPFMDGTAAPGTAITYSRGDHVHPTDTSRLSATAPAGGDLTGAYPNPTLLATVNPNVGTFQGITVNAKGLVTAAANQNYATQAALANTNYIDNSGFTVNQRGYTSGTVLAAGAFSFDRWKGGAAGATLTFTATPASTVVTITAGSLQQVVEGSGLLTGSYTLSWTGTAQGRIGAGSYAASPVAVSATAGSNLTVEFNAGTLSRAKLEFSSVATTWMPEPPQQALARCQRFYQIGNIAYDFYSTIANAVFGALQPFAVTMRATPTITLGASPTLTNCTIGSSGAGLGPQGFHPFITASAAGQCYAGSTFTASADL